jgi:hypothetical protein
MPKYKPLDELCRETHARAASCEDNKRFFSDEFKRVREILALCRFAKLHRDEGFKPDFKFVDGADDSQRVPDFVLFSSESDRRTAFEVEVAEIMEPERKRHDEYRSGDRSGEAARDNLEPGPDYMEDLVRHVSCELEKKLVKAYPSGTRLLVYFQPDKFIYWLMDGEDRETIDRIFKTALTGKTSNGISEIWVLPNLPASYLLKFQVPQVLRRPLV